MRRPAAAHCRRDVGAGPELGERHRIDEDLVVGQAAHREVGTRVGARRGEKGRVQRERAEQVDAVPRDPLAEPLEVGIRPDTPVVLRANGMHGHERTESPGRDRAGRCRKEQGRIRRPDAFERQVVSPDRDDTTGDRREVDGELEPLATRIDGPPLGTAGERAGQRRASHVAVLELERQPHVVAIGRRREGGHDRSRPIHPVHQHGFEVAPRLRFPLFTPDLVCGVGRREGYPERVEKGDDDLNLGLLPAPLHVHVGRLDAMVPGEAGQCRVQAHVSDPRMERIPRAGMSTHVGRLFIS